MNGSRSAERVGQEIVRLCHAGLDSRTLRVEVIRHLRKVIPVDASFFATADPATLLFTSAVVDDVLAQATTRFVENEFLKDDSVKFARLAGGRSPVGSLGVATEGERTALLIGDARAAHPLPEGPGLVLLGDDLSQATIPPAEEGWLAEVAT